MLGPMSIFKDRLELFRAIAVMLGAAHPQAIIEIRARAESGGQRVAKSRSGAILIHYKDMINSSHTH